MDIKLYIKAARPFSFTVSFVPPALALVLAWAQIPNFYPKWSLFVLTFLGGFLAHAGSNILSDYFDYKKGIDRPGTYGSSGVLVNSEMTPSQVLNLALFCFLSASIIGLAIMISIPNGFSLLWLVAAGGFLGFFYTTPPFILKYRAWGDFAVFMAFGPLMTLGGYFVQTGIYSIKPFLLAFPVAMIVDAILHANNIRDIENDKRCQIKTVAGILGKEKAIGMYEILLYGSYVFIILFVAVKMIHPYSLLALFSLPLAKSNIEKLKGEKIPPDADAMTAKLHSAFSVLLMAGLFLGKIFR
ncbi:MAG: prenyltransferase [Elusimicrobia bacterium]|nr:prenyltransferase [Elusimicrobiota bacterium]